MSYQVLARKWRPRGFAEMVGQEHVLQALINALNNQRLHHAYLFTGTRGVGKTSIARILAKCLNCEQGISATPCEQCSACNEINEGRFVDLIEVDAASRTRVEDTRELLDNVQYSPSRGRYKVYLIDEVHMLSGHSFNALLKTLEEPPPHVKFLLATTDPQKLPITVLTRCLQFNLKNLLPDRIAQQLQHILDQEQISYEQGALRQLARAADGSMRDALSLMDQAIAFGGESVKETDVRSMLGTIEQGHVFNLLNALANHDAEQLLAAINHLAEHAPDFANALEECLSALHRVAISQTVSNAFDDNFADHEQIQQLAEVISREDVQLFYQIGLNGRRDLPLAPNPKAGFEMIMLRMLAFRPGAVTTKAIQTKAIQGAQFIQQKVPAPAAPITQKKTEQIKEPEQVQAITPAPTPPPINEAPIETQPVITEPKPISPEPTPIIEKDDLLGTANTSSKWNDILPQLKLTGPTQALAAHCILKEMTETHFHLLLDESQSAFLNATIEKRLKEALNKYLGKEVRLEITVGKPDINTPATQQRQEDEAKLAEAKRKIEADPNVQAIISAFDATIAPDSIRAEE